MRRALIGLALLLALTTCSQADEAVPADVDRSPADVVLNRGETRLITANRGSSTLSLIDISSGTILHEISCTAQPTALALAPDESFVLVTGAHGGDLQRFRIQDTKLLFDGTIHLSFDPRGVAISADACTAYVALASGQCVAVVDLESMSLRTKIEVGRWPRSVALGPNGRLAVACSGAGGVSVIDTTNDTLLFAENFVGLNLGQLALSPDGTEVFFPWIAYGANPISEHNIQQGWVIASRIGRVALEKKQRRKAIALDPRGQAVGDPTGMALTSDGEWMVASAAGTHELLVFRLPGLGFHDYGGPGDHIDPAVLADDQRFYRIEVGGRPLSLRMGKENRHVYIANALSNCIQVVDLHERAVARAIPLGGADSPSLARRGEAIFHDARRSLDQWYSCHTCHFEGSTNAVTMDTQNDNSVFTFKTVLPLTNLAQTAPYTWHGWQKSLKAAMAKSLADTMHGPKPTGEDVEALLAYFEQLTPPPNPYRQPDGALTEAAQRGEAVFRSADANCIQCHSGPYYTDGKIHDVGTGGSADWYDGYNTPSLLGVHDKQLFLHDGRAKSLEQLLSGKHNPENVAGTRPLTDEELSDLVAYLKSL